MTETLLVRGLKPALLAAHPVLAAAAGIPDVKTRGRFNIVALVISADGRQLLVGFCSLLLGQHAIIACVENPAAIHCHRAIRPLAFEHAEFSLAASRTAQAGLSLLKADCGLPGRGYGSCRP